MQTGLSHRKRSIAAVYESILGRMSSMSSAQMAMPHSCAIGSSGALGVSRSAAPNVIDLPLNVHPAATRASAGFARFGAVSCLA